MKKKREWRKRKRIWENTIDIEDKQRSITQ